MTDQATENDDVQCTGAAKKIKWTMPRNNALLAQVISTGVKAFITSKANDKSKKDAVKYNQGDAWTNKEDGILTMLAQHPAFQGVTLPTYQSVINHITGAAGLLKKYDHLYKPGKEQDEPAAAGTEGTKNEAALDEFETAIIEVAELYQEAKALEAGNRAEKEKAQEKHAAAGRFMQNASVERKYGGLTEEELKAARKGRKAKRGDEGSDEERGVAKKKKKKTADRTPKGERLPRKLTVADYVEKMELAKEEEEELLGGVAPEGWKLIIPDGTGDEEDFAEAYLEKIRSSDSPGNGGASGFREQLGNFMDERAENATKKMELAERRLALDEKKAAAEEKKAAAEEKKNDALIGALLAIANGKKKKKKKTREASSDSSDSEE